MRAYTVDVAAIALDVDRKFLDNLLSHHAIPGCVGVRQGVRRRIARDGITRLAIAIALARELGVPIARAVDLACRLHADRELEAGGAIRIALDLAALERTLDPRLATAIESAREPRRGRPPRRVAPG
jgi:hypothetical protein